MLLLEFSSDILGPYPGNAEAFCVGFSDVSWNETPGLDSSSLPSQGMGVGHGLKSAGSPVSHVKFWRLHTTQANHCSWMFLVEPSIYTHWKPRCEIKTMNISILFFPVAVQDFVRPESLLQHGGRNENFRARDMEKVRTRVACPP